MSTPKHLPFPWTPVNVPTRVTPPRPARLPDRGSPTRRPLSLPVTPPPATSDAGHGTVRLSRVGDQPGRADVTAAARLGIALRTAVP